MYTEKLNRLEEYAIPTIRQYIELGWLKPLETMIPLYRKDAIESGQREFINLFGEFDSWLHNAKMYEATNGAGSLFRHDHPEIVAARARRLALLAEKRSKRERCSTAAKRW